MKFRGRALCKIEVDLKWRDLRLNLKRRDARIHALQRDADFMCAQIRAEILNANFKLKYKSCVFILSRIAFTRLSASHSDKI